MATREEALLWYLAWKTGQVGGAPVKTRLVKLAYLVELAFAQAGAERVTDLDWRFHHYGPYATGVDQAIDSLLATKALRPVGPKAGAVRPIHLYRARFPPARLLGPELRAVTDEVVARWGRADLEDLLNHVYFETAPMRSAVRGQKLDLAAEATEAKPVENYAPLEPPEVSGQLRQRVAEWRRDLRATPKPAPLQVAGDEEEWALMAVGEMSEPADPQAVMARGRLGSGPGLEVAD
jgi:hypothetical protein